jgi:hypothetical protein
MARAKVTKLRATAPRPALSPGLSAGTIEGRVGDSFSIRLLGGEVVSATPAPELEPAFVEECMRERRTVLVTPGPGDAVVLLGALQTARGVSRDARDNVRVEGARVEIEAREGVVFHVGKSTLKLDRQGAVKIVGQRMTADVAEVVRILSALVELP